MRKRTLSILAFGVVIILLCLGLYWATNQQVATDTNTPSPSPTSQTPEPTKPARQNEDQGTLVQPLTDALTRITKKPLGIKISPERSPVSPERFAGYHTGVDFKTLPSEQASEVPVYAVCSGPLLLKKWASGYGGVAVQKCKLANQDITVIYGHLELTSLTAKVSEELTAGEQLGMLGQGHSSETDGERKHLHLGIHLGTVINLKGYAPTEIQLKQWLNIALYL